MRFCKRDGRRRRGFLGQLHGKGMQPFFFSVVRGKQPSAAAYFVSPDLQRHLHITINTTDGNLLLGQPSPSTALPCTLSSSDYRFKFDGRFNPRVQKRIPLLLSPLIC